MMLEHLSKPSWFHHHMFLLKSNKKTPALFVLRGYRVMEKYLSHRCCCSVVVVDARHPLQSKTRIRRHPIRIANDVVRARDFFFLPPKPKAN